MTDGAWCIEGEGTPLIPAPDLGPDAFLARMEEPEQPPPLEGAAVPLFDEGGPDDSF